MDYLTLIIFKKCGNSALIRLQAWAPVAVEWGRRVVIGPKSFTDQSASPVLKGKAALRVRKQKVRNNFPPLLGSDCGITHAEIKIFFLPLQSSENKAFNHLAPLDLHLFCTRLH